MRAAEFLRGIADMLAAIEDDNKPAQPPVIVNVTGNTAEPIAPVNDNDDDENDADTVMFPQQQKLEIMKKLAGLPNQANKLKTIVADEDEPFDG